MTAEEIICMWEDLKNTTTNPLYLKEEFEEELAAEMGIKLSTELKASK